jgi:hypothetical protein
VTSVQCQMRSQNQGRACASDKDLALRFPSHARARFQSLRVRRRCKVSSLESKCSRSTVHIPCRSLTTLNQRPPLIPYALPASAHGYSLLGPISCVLAAWHCFNLCRQSWKLGEPETLTCRFCRAEESVFFEPSGCLAIAWYHLGWLILLQTPSTYSTLRVSAATNQPINKSIDQAVPEACTTCLFSRCFLPLACKRVRWRHFKLPDDEQVQSLNLHPELRTS